MARVNPADLRITKGDRWAKILRMDRTYDRQREPNKRSEQSYMHPFHVDLSVSLKEAT